MAFNCVSEFILREKENLLEKYCALHFLKLPFHIFYSWVNKDHYYDCNNRKYSIRKSWNAIRIVLK